MKKNIIHKICFYYKADFSTQNISKINSYLQESQWLSRVGITYLAHQWNDLNTRQKKMLSKLFWSLITENTQEDINWLWIKDIFIYHSDYSYKQKRQEELSLYKEFHKPKTFKIQRNEKEYYI